MSRRHGPTDCSEAISSETHRIFSCPVCRATHYESREDMPEARFVGLSCLGDITVPATGERNE